MTYRIMKKEIIETGGLWVPVIIAEPPKPRAVLLVGHGLGVSKEAQLPEIENLARSGFVGIVYDAPHHGDRRDSFLDLMNQADEIHRHDLYLSIIEQASGETPQLIKIFKEKWHLPVGVSGVSMGGFIAFASALRDPGPDFLVSIIGSPDWYSFSMKVEIRDFACPRVSPKDFPEKFKNLKILAVTAGKDEVVLPEPAKEFIMELKKRFPENSGAFQLEEFPLSGHLMREEDWLLAWKKIISWLEKNF